MIRISTFIAVLGLPACATVTDFRTSMASFDNTIPAVSSMPISQPSVFTAKERILTAIEDQGCVLDGSTVLAILGSATVTQEDLKLLIPQLQSEGRVEVKDDQSIRSTSANCINA